MRTGLARCLILGGGAMLACGGGSSNESDARPEAIDAAFQDGSSGPPISIPAPGDWEDQGQLFSAGKSGDWDLYLWGGFANAVVKRNQQILLYYQGSDGYDDVEETVTYRAIGVAVSDDGFTFTKHASNPVVTWTPSTDKVEEGAASGGAFLEGSEVVFYYGANTAGAALQVHADGRISVSEDGLNFSDQGVVLSRLDDTVWGAGDELFPVMGLRHDDRWVSYYIPNGAPEARLLGAAWGDARDSLPNTDGVRANGESVGAWGPASSAEIAPGEYAIFVNNNADEHDDGQHVDVYTVDITEPNRFQGPVTSYAFADMSRGVVLLDREKELWMLYHRDADASNYRLKTAPVR